MKKKEKELVEKLSREEIALDVERAVHARVKWGYLAAKLARLIDRLKDKYGPKIDAAKLDDEVATERVEVWTWAQERAGALDERKTIDFVHAAVSLRIGSWGVKLKRKMTDQQVAEALEKEEWGKRYVKMVPALDRLALIRDREQIDAKEAERIGFAIDRDEEFYLKHRGEEPAVAG